MAYTIPPELIARFRADAQRRLERVEAAWMRLAASTEPREQARQMARELHTLKGDAHIIGFRDASQLCHKLEELLAAAERHAFHVGDELDLAVTMAIGFAGMIVRRKPDAPAEGIDLPGFLRHIDEILDEVDAVDDEAPPPAALPAPAAGPAAPVDGLSARSSAQLAIIATDLYLGVIASEGATRAHLHACWAALVERVERLRSVPLDRRLLRHAHAARLLAGDLGRDVDVVFEVGPDAVGAHAAEALDEALVHAIRNAIDHGIRPAAERRARGKPARGVVRIASAVSTDRVVVIVADDGDGVDLAAVRRSAVARGLVAAGTALSDDDALAHLFTPGFSTRADASEVSGRGVGLDAVRAAVRAEGGDVAITTSPAGTTLSIHVPHQEPGVAVHCFAGAVEGTLVAVATDWTPDEDGAPEAGHLALELGRTGAVVGPDRVVVVGPDGTRAVLPARWPPVRAHAERVCPTPADHPLEVVRVDGAEALLVRPQALARPPRVRRSTRLTFDEPSGG